MRVFLSFASRGARPGIFEGTSLYGQISCQGVTLSGRGDGRRGTLQRQGARNGSYPFFSEDEEEDELDVAEEVGDEGEGDEDGEEEPGLDPLEESDAADPPESEVAPVPAAAGTDSFLSGCSFCTFWPSAGLSPEPESAGGFILSE